MKKPFSSKQRHLAFRAGKAPTPAGDAAASTTAAKDPTRRRRHLSRAGSSRNDSIRAEAAVPAEKAHGGVKGKRKSKKDKLREAARSR